MRPHWVGAATENATRFGKRRCRLVRYRRLPRAKCGLQRELGTTLLRASCQPPADAGEDHEREP